MEELRILLEMGDFLRGVAQYRKHYEATQEIAVSDVSDPAEKEEAQRLIEGGIYCFINRMVEVLGGK